MSNPNAVDVSASAALYRKAMVFCTSSRKVASSTMLPFSIEFLTKPPFKVASAEFVIFCPELYNLVI